MKSGSMEFKLPSDSKAGYPLSLERITLSDFWHTALEPQLFSRLQSKILHYVLFSVLEKLVCNFHNILPINTKFIHLEQRHKNQSIPFKREWRETPKGQFHSLIKGIRTSLRNFPLDSSSPLW